VWLLLLKKILNETENESYSKMETENVQNETNLKLKFHVLVE